MAVKTYDELMAAAKAYARRDDITDDAWDLLLRTAEARIYRLLRVPNTEETTIWENTTGPRPVPTDLIQVKQMWITGCGDLTRIDESTRQAMIRNYKTNPAETKYFSRVSNQFNFWPEPNNVTVNLIYHAEPIGINADNQFSSMLNIAFDAYLFGMMVEVMSFTHYHEMLQPWETRFKTALAEVQDMADKAEFSGSIKQEETTDLDVGNY